ncbi:hypothetical protein NUU61_001290 [Penicillium alfredii]|uniref:Cytochrome P450 n=1 Tax=Penicillium alfredii TaxID=1506179 RepID=A0A9W9KMH6_9EURO|nr:uncharacterized protein NUU61_001290 [Penicillium alfredii]KAJ5111660.1 hypothetical protein NUU61_001290 [Penicillium alfredii]
MALTHTYLNSLWCFLGTLVVTRFLWSYLRSPLKPFPGPIAARFTDIWRFQDVLKGRCDVTYIQLHRKHGSVVRMGPNILSLSDPKLIKQVFTTRNPWLKSDMYNVNDVVVAGVRYKNLFSHQDENWHSIFIRPVKPIYSMRKVQEAEPAIDLTIELLIKVLRECFVTPNNVCDMSKYLMFFAWDTMSQVTISRTLGILEAGWDHQRILETSEKSLDYFARTSQMPWMDMLFDKNPLLRLGPPGFAWATAFSYEELEKRRQRGPAPNIPPDFLDKFLDEMHKRPDIIDTNMVVTYLLSNVLAGSDTTGSAMCSALYNILKHPQSHQKLRYELRCGGIQLPAQWRDLKCLPYLDAVMRESMRIYPPIGLMIERVVPVGGFTLPDGRFVPEGTIVGMNPWVINRNEDIFGPSTDSFIPERWLPTPGESDEDYKVRFTKMNSVDFTFGAGSRTCLGRDLARLESYKLIAMLFITFDVRSSSPLAPPAPNLEIFCLHQLTLYHSSDGTPRLDHECHVTNSWFVRLTDIPVRLKERGDLGFVTHEKSC